MDKRQRFLHKEADSDEDLYEDPNAHLADNAPDLAPTQAAINSVNAVELNRSNSSVRADREYTLVTQSNRSNVDAAPIKIHSLNLNNQKQRSVSLAMLLCIWSVPTLILSLDFYDKKDSQEVDIHFSTNQNRLHIASLSLLLTATVLLLGFEVVEFRHRMVQSSIGILFIIGGCLHFALSIWFSHGKCRDSKATHVDTKNAWCYMGYLGTSILGAFLPVTVGIDIMCPIMNNKFVRVLILSIELWMSTLCSVLTITKYGNDFGDDFPGLMFVMDSNLFTVLSTGWWMLCHANFIAMAEIIICVYVLHLHKFKFDRLYMRLFNMVVGLALILSVSMILIDKDACITGEPLSGDFFCYYKLVYVLVGLTCVVAYEMQTLSG